MVLIKKGQDEAYNKLRLKTLNVVVLSFGIGPSRKGSFLLSVELRYLKEINTQLA